MKKHILIIVIIIGLVSCSSDDGNQPIPDILISVTNSQNWDSENVTASDLGTTEFTDENGEILIIERLRYLISKVILTNSYGDEIEIGSYKLVDLTDNNTLNYATNILVPPGTYTGISFVYGFNEEDNIDQAYPDLNTASWNWPEPLGGGYHFMQLDGTFTSPTNLNNPLPFNYHNGTARISDGVFEQNFIRVNITELSIDNSTTIDIKMNLAEWFKNPNLWDLNVLNTGLMGNYDAQREMNENGQSVFSVYLGD